MVPWLTTHHAVKMSDQLGHTWAQIVGADNIMNSPIGTTASERHGGVDRRHDRFRRACSLTADTYADGAETLTSANYDGIPGTVYCLGTDCKVDSNGKLAGSWYFTPASTTDYYRKVGTDTNYTAETAYAQFGHWLTTVSASNDGWRPVNTYARVRETIGAVAPTMGPASQ